MKSKVGDFKKKKQSREERKKKWENWKKTEAIFWKKTSTNYSKWDYFTSSSEEEEDKEPILPRHDPNFLALEKDVEERAARRRAEKKSATILKDEGNEAMKKHDYLKAIEAYSTALDKVKDMKELYTNRALAYIKIGKYDSAIEDCTRVLEYAEVFEEGYMMSKELCYKVIFPNSN